MKRHRLTPNFITGEFFGIRKNKVGFVQATSLRAACEVQKIRSKTGKPVVIVSSSITGEPSNRIYRIKLSTSEGPRTVSIPWRKRDMRVYGFNAHVTDRVLGIMKPGIDTLIDSIRRGTFGLNNAVALMAMLQLDYKEGDGNNTVYGVEMGLNNVPWCAIFYHWCKAQVDSVLGTKTSKFDPELSNSRITFNKAPVRVTEMAEFKPGYAIIWEKTDSPVAGHTGVCIHNDPEKRIMVLVEPNYSNKVTLRLKSYDKLNRGTLKVLGACSYWTDDNEVGTFMGKTNLSEGTFINKSESGTASTR